MIFLKTKKNCAHNTTIKYITNFKKVVRIAYANGWINKDPFFNWKARLKNVEREFLSEEEIQEMILKEINKMANVKFPRKEFEKYIKITPDIEKKIVMFGTPLESLTDDEIEIILKLLSYPYIVKLASNAREPHRLTNFIEDVSASFHSFWNKGKENESLRFIDEKNVIKTQTKLIWLQSMRIVFENIFNIIGIDYHETM